MSEGMVLAAGPAGKTSDTCSRYRSAAGHAGKIRTAYPPAAAGVRLTQKASPSLACSCWARRTCSRIVRRRASALRGVFFRLGELRPGFFLPSPSAASASAFCLALVSSSLRGLGLLFFCLGVASAFAVPWLCGLARALGGTLLSFFGWPVRVRYRQAASSRAHCPWRRNVCTRTAPVR